MHMTFQRDLVKCAATQRKILSPLPVSRAPTPFSHAHMLCYAWATWSLCSVFTYCKVIKSQHKIIITLNLVLQSTLTFLTVTETMCSTNTTLSWNKAKSYMNKFSNQDVKQQGNKERYLKLPFRVYGCQNCSENDAYSEFYSSPKEFYAVWKGLRYDHWFYLLNSAFTVLTKLNSLHTKNHFHDYFCLLNHTTSTVLTLLLLTPLLVLLLVSLPLILLLLWYYCYYHYY